MWPDCAKAFSYKWCSDQILLVVNKQAFVTESYAVKKIGHADLAKPDRLKGLLKYNLAQINQLANRHKHNHFTKNKTCCLLIIKTRNYMLE